MIRIAKCVAIILIWKQIAGYNNYLYVILVIVNSFFQLIFHIPLLILYCYATSHGHSNVSNSEMYEVVAKLVYVFSCE